MERILAGAHEFAELRLLATIRAGRGEAAPDALTEAERLLGGDGGAPAARLGLDPDAGPAELHGRRARRRRAVAAAGGEPDVQPRGVRRRAPGRPQLRRHPGQPDHPATVSPASRHGESRIRAR